jgi:hypothetical protein
MIKFLKNNFKFLILLFVGFIIFYPSLFTFYTNDDFFFLNISNTNSLLGFFSFFNLAGNPDGFGMYRPLTTQAYYFLSWKLFNLNPIGLHLFSFIFFFAVIYLVHKLIYELSKNEKIAFIGALLYTVSSSHYAHLYYLAAFQELGVALFVLLSVISFFKKRTLFSILFFVLGLLSKETAVVTPLLILAVQIYRQQLGVKALPMKTLVKSIIPHVIILGFYLFARFFYYGFATGDSYVWDFSVKKFANTIMWYVLWSFNLPETLVDFIGPGFRLNPNLFVYWSKQMIPIFLMFGLEVLLIIIVMIKGIGLKSKTFTKENNANSLFSALWFVISLLPVAFLPLHKFTFYLTVPLVGTVFRLSYLVVKTKVSNFFIALFITVWTVLSVLSLKHTINTNWITRSQEISRKSYDFIRENYQKIDRDIVFADTENDSDLPWSPTSVVKTALSDQNFFEVFFPDFPYKIYYGASKETTNANSYIILSRTILGY